jgi:hypothetical protein
MTAMINELPTSKRRGLAVTKRGGDVGMNVARLGISIKELATLY